MILKKTNSILNKFGWGLRRIKKYFDSIDESVVINASKPNLCICNLDHNAVSQTFIRAHAQLIDANIFYLHSGYPPRLTGANQSLLDWGPSYRQGLANYLSHNKINVVLAEFGTMAAEVYETCQAVGIPLIAHFHGFDASSKPTIDKYLPKYREMFGYASYVVGVSNDMVRNLGLMGCPEEKLVYNPCGPDESFFEISPTYDSESFLAVGRFVNKKAPYLTLAAFRVVHERHPSARLVFAGDGYLLECCRNLSKYWQIDHAVDFLGAVSHQKVRDLLSGSLCFLQHSITAEDGDTEGTPVGILEACAAGLLVISTRHAGIKDVIIENETGYLVNEQDVSEMARAMLAILQQPEIAQTLGGKARKHIKDNFSIKKHIQTLDNLVCRCVMSGQDREFSVCKVVHLG